MGMSKQALDKIIQSAQFHKFMQMELIDADSESGEITLKLAYDEKYTLFPEPGSYHGGIIASLLDVAGTMACTLITESPTPTANMRVDYIKSPRKCDLYARTSVHHIGRNLATVDVDLRDESGQLYAVARGNWSVVNAKKEGTVKNEG